jgi:site-specific recombinase XerD
MLTDYFETPFALARHRGTPFGGYIDGFTEWLANQDYKDDKIRVAVQNATALGLWLPDDVAAKALDEDVLERYGKHLRRIGRFKHPSGHYSSFASGARTFLKYLRLIGVVAPPRVNLSPIVVEFADWLRNHRGAAGTTVVAYARRAQESVEALGGPREMTATAIRSYLLRRADRRGRSFVKALCQSLRSFLRFLVATGRCRYGLDAAVPAIATWRLAELPRYVSRDDVRRIVAATETDARRGLRDRAILTLLADMGLRAGDISALTFDALDWNARTMTLAGKSVVATRLPMPSSVIRAIGAYLKRSRPTVERAAVFLNLNAPHKPVSPQSIFHVVRAAIRRAGVDAPHDGPHMLRHSFAVDLLRRGLTVEAIGALLRHRSLDATLTYAKVDERRLRSLAIAWQEVAPC